MPSIVDSIDKKLDRIIVTRHGKPVLVMLSIEDYASLMETLDVLTDPQAMAGVKRGVADLRKGKTHSWQEIKQSLGKI